MSRKVFKVRKGIEAEPLVWGLTIPYWGMVTLAGATLIIIGLMMIFINLQNGGGKWYYGLYLLMFGGIALFIIKLFLESISKPKKHKFSKKEVYLNQSDLIENL
ncbi:MAG: hypothetical protein ACTHXT_09860 [Sphingobacterium sp.]|uniref:hypothetical protein n=1 Tax=Sphingobacterium sp. JB170 TaxID=1434842 RepID=UPI00097F4D99|nr:hypothetical protein [Sphingobacterium sp. JB170]SJN26909.1 hypothetical protein FM107_05130 [Sphingobacterium sp. JB170]